LLPTQEATRNGCHRHDLTLHHPFLSSHSSSNSIKYTVGRLGQHSSSTAVPSTLFHPSSASRRTVFSILPPAGMAPIAISPERDSHPEPLETLTKGFDDTVRFYLNGTKVVLDDVDPEITVLEYLRGIGLTGTKL
jgi:hypothetical protein